MSGWQAQIMTKEESMNLKKTMSIALVLFVAFVAGISAQSIEQQANTLLQRYEALAKKYENLAIKSGTLATQQRPTRQSLRRLETNRQTLSTKRVEIQAYWCAFFTTGRDVTEAQQTRLDAIGDRLRLADDRIDTNIRTINSKL